MTGCVYMKCLNKGGNRSANIKFKKYIYNFFLKKPCDYVFLNNCGNSLYNQK